MFLSIIIPFILTTLACNSLDTFKYHNQPSPIRFHQNLTFPFYFFSRCYSQMNAFKKKTNGRGLWILLMGPPAVPQAERGEGCLLLWRHTHKSVSSWGARAEQLVHFSFLVHFFVVVFLLLLLLSFHVRSLDIF